MRRGSAAEFAADPERIERAYLGEAVTVADA
jgi:hypothetical protein